MEQPAAQSAGHRRQHLGGVTVGIGSGRAGEHHGERGLRFGPGLGPLGLGPGPRGGPAHGGGSDRGQVGQDPAEAIEGRFGVEIADGHDQRSRPIQFGSVPSNRTPAGSKVARVSGVPLTGRP